MSRIVTNLKQSRKLVSLGLDVKTADFFYESEDCLGLSAAWFLHIATDAELDRHTPNLVLPAWSLAALFGILPVTTTLLKDGNISNIDDVKYNCECNIVSIHKWFDNPIDACVAMIERLYELKML